MSTSITATSSLEDVLLAASKITLSTSGWTALTPPNYLTAATPAVIAPITTWTAKVGLFGEDLTNFFKDCATVGYSECNPANFAAFSGWAIGTEITVSAIGTTGSGG
jgi:hypothetical protein